MAGFHGRKVACSAASAGVKVAADYRDIMIELQTNNTMTKALQGAGLRNDFALNARTAYARKECKKRIFFEPNTCIEAIVLNAASSDILSATGSEFR
jgi:hypothetical protein